MLVGMTWHPGALSYPGHVWQRIRAKLYARYVIWQARRRRNYPARDREPQS